MRVLLEPRTPEACGNGARAGGCYHRVPAPRLVSVSMHESAEFALGTYSAGSRFPTHLLRLPTPLAEGASREIVSDPVRERLRAFVQYLAPPPHVLLCGAGPDAQPVAAAARALGWRVTVVDHRAGLRPCAAISGASVMVADPGSLPRDGRSEPLPCGRGDEPSPGFRRRIFACPGAKRACRPSWDCSGRPHDAGASCASSVPWREGLRDARGPVGIDIGAVTPEASHSPS